jgi:hypothetical protein
VASGGRLVYNTGARNGSTEARAPACGVRMGTTGAHLHIRCPLLLLTLTRAQMHPPSLCAGRALDLFLQLLKEKGDLMPEPDMLISSVGTKIYVK